MAAIHQTLYQSQDFSNADIATGLNGLVNNLAHSYGDSSRSKIWVYVDAEAIALPIESSIPLGLIVNELVSNAYKHAFPCQKSGAIRIMLSHTPDQRIKLQVSDDGIGMPPDRKPTDSLGLRLVEALSEQLEAELDIHPAKPTTFTILI